MLESMPFNGLIPHLDKPLNILLILSGIFLLIKALFYIRDYGWSTSLGISLVGLCVLILLIALCSFGIITAGESVIYNLTLIYDLYFIIFIRVSRSNGSDKTID